MVTDNIFVNNQANEGGAFYFSGQRPTFRNNSYINNTALANYGPDISSYASHMKFMTTDAIVPSGYVQN